MLRWIVIGSFGFIGTIVRYAVQGGVQRLLGGAHRVLRRVHHVLGAHLRDVDSAEKIQKILPLLDEMVGDGMVTLEKVQVIAYRASPHPKPA